MNRRSFLSMSAAAGATLCLPRSFGAQTAALDAASGNRYDNLLILVELKGGNDGLNTVIPFADPAYYELRRNIGLERGQVIQLDERSALHPSLQTLMPLWRSGQLAVVQGVGYEQPNLSHFRSTEIWDTASRSNQYLREGWLTRTFARTPVPAGFAADGVVIGSAEMGPLANGARATVLVDPARSIGASRLDAIVSSRTPRFESAHSFGIGSDIAKAADHLRPAQDQVQLKTVFAAGAFGNSIKAATHVLAAGNAAARQAYSGAVIRLTLNGFDTHHNQPAQHAALLKQLADGLAAMKSALIELGRWNETLVMTYAEFGRRPLENQNRGTDHGTVAPHFVTGGRVLGGLYGVPPTLTRLDGNRNLPVGVDFRELYATVLGPWWGLDASAILQQRFEPLPLLRA